MKTLPNRRREVTRFDRLGFTLHTHREEKEGGRERGSERAREREREHSAMLVFPLPLSPLLGLMASTNHSECKYGLPSQPPFTCHKSGVARPARSDD